MKCKSIRHKKITFLLSYYRSDSLIELPSFLVNAPPLHDIQLIHVNHMCGVIIPQKGQIRFFKVLISSKSTFYSFSLK